MTISRGSEWGREVERPGALRIAVDDAELASLLTDGSGEPTAVSAGDLYRTLGGASIEGRDRLNRLPLDLLEVRVDDAVVHAVAHVVAMSPTSRGGLLRGPIHLAMNAEFIGDFDVAPRGHPNDGRVELLNVDSRMSMRQRLALRRRLRSASHLPHPMITTRSATSEQLSFPTPMRVRIDGIDRGVVRSLALRVMPDAAVLYA